MLSELYYWYLVWWKFVFLFRKYLFFILPWRVFPKRAYHQTTSFQQYSKIATISVEMLLPRCLIQSCFAYRINNVLKVCVGVLYIRYNVGRFAKIELVIEIGICVSYHNCHLHWLQAVLLSIELFVAAISRSVNIP